MFPVNGSLHMAPRFPRSGPGEPGSPTSSVLLRCYDVPSRMLSRLLASLPRPTRFSVLRVSHLRSQTLGAAVRARVLVQPATPMNRFARAWTCAGPPRFPDDPSRAYAPLFDPGRTDDPSPFTVSSMLPPRFP